MPSTPTPRRASATRVVRTTCPYCAVQCNFDLQIEDNLPVKATPTKECPVAHGTVCKKGLSALNDLRHPDRLTQPLLRENGELVPVSWTEALAYVSDALGPLLATQPTAVGVLGSGALTNEKTYLLGKFARLALRTANIDYNGRYCMSSAATALNRTVGYDRGLGFPLEEISTSDLILLVGANIAETLPPVMQYLKRARDRGATVYAIDPRATPTAKVAGHHLAVRPGTDGILALGLLHLMKAWGRIRPTAPAHGMPEVLWQADDYPPASVASACGVAEDELMTLAKLYANAHKPLILTGRGPEQHAYGTDTVQAYLNLAFLTGHFGKPGGGYGTLTGQGNGQGGREHGQKADQLPGARSLRNPKHRREIAALWGCLPEDLPQPGLSAQELLNACGEAGGIEALIVLGSNPIVSAPGALQVRQRLSALKHLIVIDVLPSETAQLATLVLPGSMWCEEEGTTTNLEGRVQRRRQAITPPAAAREDWRILCDLAAAIGRPQGFTYATFRELQDEFFRATGGGVADYSGLSAERLDRASAQWPVRSADGPDTPYAYAPKYPTPDGLARLHVPSFPPLPLSHHLLLTTGRLGNQYQSGTQTRRNPALRATLELQVHPETARERSLKPGDLARVTTSHGTLDLPVALNPGLRPDTLFMPFHWEASANLLTSPDRLDPHSRMPAFKATPATLMPVPVSVPEAQPARIAPLEGGVPI
ncbi:assimilatory nitrate reductase, catalytic subunit (plasmid) [Deinococcus geothermalis DSM 11300]|uniref:Assimilatory nitrate reductase, catalytic subunit n=1 Tax=Deinococcus geothermalis (strain DSM 11300 / CIP 105573 / AG-3a) TaxID=319795 RepID=Q1J3V9_DEIGD|nr:molybdopterin oxidoreductase family protein [Deinococcus geothermalis]ABF43825.1 assimilatory nitrate reductase, catalytic subunit [Deinococcus geothermalis DSM 11300]